MRWPSRGPLSRSWLQTHSSLPTDLSVTFASSTAWMLGSTPPCTTVTSPKNSFNSSSLRLAIRRCRGMIRVFLLSRAYKYARLLRIGTRMGRQRRMMRRHLCVDAALVLADQHFPFIHSNTNTFFLFLSTLHTPSVFYLTASFLTELR